MDNYFKLANSILREQSPTFSLESETEQEEIRSLDGFFSDEEGHVEDQEILNKDQEKAVDFAYKLATKAAKAGLMAKDPQKEINKAYGKMMTDVAAKIKTIKI